MRNHTLRKYLLRVAVPKGSRGARMQQQQMFVAKRYKISPRERARATFTYRTRGGLLYVYMVEVLREEIRVEGVLFIL